MLKLCHGNVNQNCLKIDWNYLYASVTWIIKDSLNWLNDKDATFIENSNCAQIKKNPTSFILLKLEALFPTSENIAFL